MNTTHLNRRQFIKTSSAVTLGTTLFTSGLACTSAEIPKENNLLVSFYNSLSPVQKAAINLPWEHPKREFVDNNWNVVDEEKYSIADFYSSPQQTLLHNILKENLSENGFKKYEKQMSDDSEGFGHFTCALFGDPKTENSKLIFTGRHVTLRVDNTNNPNTALGGAVFYGHAVRFNEKADHPGNVWWHQSLLANDLFKNLSTEQQKIASVTKSLPDKNEVVKLKGSKGTFTGLSAKNLTPEQKTKLQNTLNSLLVNYPAQQIAKATKIIEASGGLDALHISFYQEGDLGDDKIWDRWLIEGPSFVWYFRGSPHVHSWVNIAKTI